MKTSVKANIRPRIMSKCSGYAKLNRANFRLSESDYSLNLNTSKVGLSTEIIKSVQKSKAAQTFKFQRWVKHFTSNQTCMKHFTLNLLYRTKFTAVELCIEIYIPQKH